MGVFFGLRGGDGAAGGGPRFGYALVSVVALAALILGVARCDRAARRGRGQWAPVGYDTVQGPRDTLRLPPVRVARAGCIVAPDSVVSLPPAPGVSPGGVADAPPVGGGSDSAAAPAGRWRVHSAWFHDSILRARVVDSFDTRLSQHRMLLRYELALHEAPMLVRDTRYILPTPATGAALRDGRVMPRWGGFLGGGVGFPLGGCGGGGSLLVSARGGLRYGRVLVGAELGAAAGPFSPTPAGGGCVAPYAGLWGGYLW